MKLIDKYIYAIAMRLPYSKRDDIKKELKSLLLDELENKYGDKPTEKEVKEFINSFGSPRKIAKEYAGETNIIGSGFTDLYFLIIKIVIFALSIAFSVVFIVEVISNNLSGMDIVNELVKVPLNIFNSSLGAIGGITIVFIVLTRLYKENIIDLDDDWTVKELETIKLDDEKESIIESAFTIFFLVILIGLLNIYPDVLRLAEDSLIKGIELDYRIIVDQFANYVIVLSILWVLEIIYHIALIKVGINTIVLRIFKLLITASFAIIFFIMVMDTNLYITVLKANPSIIGVKIIFIINSVASLISSVSQLYKIITCKRVEN